MLAGKNPFLAAFMQSQKNYLTNEKKLRNIRDCPENNSGHILPFCISTYFLFAIYWIENYTTLNVDDLKQIIISSQDYNTLVTIYRVRYACTQFTLEEFPVNMNSILGPCRSLRFTKELLPKVGLACQLFPLRVNMRNCFIMEKEMKYLRFLYWCLHRPLSSPHICLAELFLLNVPLNQLHSIVNAVTETTEWDDNIRIFEPMDDLVKLSLYEEKRIFLEKRNQFLDSDEKIDLHRVNAMVAQLCDDIFGEFTID